MHELVVNLHIHTVYSDGSGTHHQVAAAALEAGLDVILVSDHNVLVENMDRYHTAGRRKVLLLVGEEIHDQDRDPQKNHLLAFGCGKELAALADDPAALIQAVRQAGGICFLAHPNDPELPVFNETDISWVDWDVEGFTGIELWNGFSELKSIVRSRLGALPYAYFPAAIARGPLVETLQLWDRLLAGGKPVVAVGGSDAHARLMSLGPLRRTIFPYGYHFRAVNTHLLVPRPLGRDLAEDRRMVLAALAGGRAFIGYDLGSPTRGFRFSAHGKDQEAVMGEEIKLKGPITLQTRIPLSAECLLLRDGVVIRRERSEGFAHLISEPGVYRVEVYRRYLGRRRGWIFSNPIYVH